MKPTIAIPLAAAILCAALSAAPADAAVLKLEGPTGMAVRLDGVDLGVLPLPDRQVDVGAHELTGELKGAESFATGFTVRDEAEIVTLLLRPEPLSRREAALSSLVFAGLGQRYEGKRTLGWILTGAEALGLLTALVSDLEAQNSRDEYRLALAEYENALTPDDVATWRTATESHYDDWKSGIDRRDAGLLIAAGAVVVSVLDAVFRFPALEAGVDLRRVGPQPDVLSSTPPAGGVHLALRLGF